VDFGELRLPVDSSENHESLSDGDDPGCYGRAARFEDHALVHHIHVRPRINGQCHRKCLGPLVFEVVGLEVSSAELALQRLPCHQLRPGQDMEAVSQPQVAVEGGGVVVDGADGRLFERDGVLLELLKEAFGQFGRF